MPKYIKKDTELGYLENSIDIEKAKFDNMRHVVLGCMLGDFDENGNYDIDPEIVKELVGMKKYLVDSVDNIEIFKGELMLDKDIMFSVSFEGGQATLSLLEKINFEANYKLNSGVYSNINEYVLDKIITSGEVDRNTVYRKWNISSFDGEMLDIMSAGEDVLAKYFGIVKRFKQLINYNTELLNKEEELEEIEAQYTENLLEVLSHYPNPNELVIADLKKACCEHKDSLKIDKPYYFKTLNEIIENSIDKNKKCLSEEELSRFEAEKLTNKQFLNVYREECCKDNLLNSSKLNFSAEKSALDLMDDFIKAKQELEAKIKERNKKIANHKSEVHSALERVVVKVGNVIGENLVGEYVEVKIEKKEGLVAQATENNKQTNIKKKSSSNSGVQQKGEQKKIQNNKQQKQTVKAGYTPRNIVPWWKEINKDKKQKDTTTNKALTREQLEEKKLQDFINKNGEVRIEAQTAKINGTQRTNMYVDNENANANKTFEL